MNCGSAIYDPSEDMENFGGIYYNIYNEPYQIVQKYEYNMDPINQRMKQIADERLVARFSVPHIMGMGVEGIYCGPGKIPKGKKLGTAKQCIKNKQLRYWGVKEVDPELLEGINDELTAEKQKNMIIKEQLKLKKLEDNAKILINDYKKLKIKLDNAINDGKKHKSLDSMINKIIQRKDRLVKNIKKQRQIVEAMKEEDIDEEQAFINEAAKNLKQLERREKKQFKKYEKYGLGNGNIYNSDAVHDRMEQIKIARMFQRYNPPRNMEMQPRSM